MDLMNAGADAVQACTAPIFDPFLAWKTRFHLNRIDTVLVKSDQPRVEDFPFPRNNLETESFRNAEIAVEAIRKRSDQKISHEVFRLRWNEWMRERPNTQDAFAHRSRKARTVLDW